MEETEEIIFKVVYVWKSPMWMIQDPITKDTRMGVFESGFEWAGDCDYTLEWESQRNGNDLHIMSDFDTYATLYNYYKS